MAESLPTCGKDGIPLYRLALAKEKCLRGPRLVNILSTPALVIDFFKKHWGCKPQESFVVLHLDVQNSVIGAQEVALGGTSAAPVDPKVLFSGALLAGASAVILMHNHPSGNPEPSTEDSKLTKQLVAAGVLLGIKVLDHIVVAGDGHTSFLEKGLL